MFLTVGDKIKLCRKKYHLKQVSFEKYGIMQYYLSHLENNKRNPSNEMIQTIYEAIFELTNGAICIDYSFNEFKKTVFEQAKEWLEQQYEIRQRYDDELYKIAKEYSIVEILIDIYKQFGYEEQEKNNYQKSNEYFENAAQCAITLNQSPIIFYKKIGGNLRNNLNNEGALAYYKRALNYAKTDEEKYNLMYHLGVVESNLGNYQRSIDYADININCSVNETTIVVSILLKEHALRQMGKFDEGRAVLNQYIKNPFQNLMLDIAYYNLACNYSANEMTTDTLNVCFYILSKKKHISEEVRYKTLLLVGYVYRKLSRYQEALDFLDSIKVEIFQECEQRFIQWFYETYIEILMELKRDKELMVFMKDIQQLLESKKLNQSFYSELNKNLLTYIILNNKMQIYESFIRDMK